MKKLFLSAATVALAISAFAGDNTLDEKVLMTVNGRDVKVSEFNYLFKKNNSQQLAPQSIDDYIGMFVDYKLKVADAETAGIDTTASFIAEYSKFRDELAAPYLRDKSVEDALMQEAYGHMRRDVNVSHIMVNKLSGPNPSALLDSVRNAIVKGEISFEEAAAKYSVDTPSAVRGGLMGWLPAGRFPWSFEKAAYDTKVGEISPVIDSGFGYHIVKVNETRQSKGQVHASHILKLTRDLPAEAVAAQKVAIDSIYTLLKNGADFAELAKAESEDPGSASRGGDLGWFGSGMMVAEFDSVAFALPDGQISEPFTTAFGYHIIKRFDHRDIEPFDEVSERIKAMMVRDGRDDQPRQAKLKQLKKKYDVVALIANRMSLKHHLGNSPVDSALFIAMANDATPMVRIGDQNITVAQAFLSLTPTEYPDALSLISAIEQKADELADDVVTQHAIADLETENAEYRNLINEYRDGILLFEISNRNVWDRAAKDKDGLEDYFHKNIAKYKWDVPRYKGYVVFAANDSIIGEALKFAETVTTDNPEQFVEAMRKEFGKNIKIERVIAAKGENPITDNIAFGGEKPTVKSPRWASYAACRGRVIDQPEEAADLRGVATTDYQNVLEQQWLKKIRKTYPVKIDKKVLKEVKQQSN